MPGEPQPPPLKEAVRAQFAQKAEALAKAPDATQDLTARASSLFDRVLAVEPTTETDATATIDLAASTGKQYFDDLVKTRGLYADRIAAVRKQLQDEVASGHLDRTEELKLLTQLETSVSGAIAEDVTARMKGSETESLTAALSEMAKLEFRTKLTEDVSPTYIENAVRTYNQIVWGILTRSGIDPNLRSASDMARNVTASIEGVGVTQEDLDRQREIYKIFAETQVARFVRGGKISLRRTERINEFIGQAEIAATREFTPQEQEQITSAMLGFIDHIDQTAGVGYTLESWQKGNMWTGGNNSMVIAYGDLTSRVFEGLEYGRPFDSFTNIRELIDTQRPGEQSSFALGVALRSVLQGENPAAYLAALEQNTTRSVVLAQLAIEQFQRLPADDPRRKTLAEMLYLGHADTLQSQEPVKKQVLEALGGEKEVTELCRRNVERVIADAKAFLEGKVINSRISELGRESEGTYDLSRALGEKSRYEISSAVAEIAHKMIYAGGIARIMDGELASIRQGIIDGKVPLAKLQESIKVITATFSSVDTQQREPQYFIDGRPPYGEDVQRNKLVFREQYTRALMQLSSRGSENIYNQRALLVKFFNKAQAYGVTHEWMLEQYNYLAATSLAVARHAKNFHPGKSFHEQPQIGWGDPFPTIPHYPRIWPLGTMIGTYGNVPESFQYIEPSSWDRPSVEDSRAIHGQVGYYYLESMLAGTGIDKTSVMRGIEANAKPLVEKINGFVDAAKQVVEVNFADMSLTATLKEDAFAGIQNAANLLDKPEVRLVQDEVLGKSRQAAETRAGILSAVITPLREAIRRQETANELYRSLSGWEYDGLPHFKGLFAHPGRDLKEQRAKLENQVQAVCGVRCDLSNTEGLSAARNQLKAAVSREYDEVRVTLEQSLNRIPDFSSNIAADVLRANTQPPYQEDSAEAVKTLKVPRWEKETQQFRSDNLDVATADFELDRSASNGRPAEGLAVQHLLRARELTRPEREALKKLQESMGSLTNQEIEPLRQILADYARKLDSAADLTHLQKALQTIVITALEGRIAELVSRDLPIAELDRVAGGILTKPLVDRYEAVKKQVAARIPEPTPVVV